jgi:GNAT superfamily N-acetyltransferase
MNLSRKPGALEKMKIRAAVAEDLETIVRLINEAPDGSEKFHISSSLPEGFHNAFGRIVDSEHDQLMVATVDEKVIGTFHVKYLYFIAGCGRPDAQVEAVHVHKDYRGFGIGAAMMDWVISEAKNRGCRRVQLTSNKERRLAHKFYRRLGFDDSHEGFRMVFEAQVARG